MLSISQKVLDYFLNRLKCLVFFKTYELIFDIYIIFQNQTKKIIAITCTEDCSTLLD